MSGPALKQHDAHHMIHQAAFQEAEDLTSLLRKLVEAGEFDKALQTTHVLVEHWQTRTLCHAASEEEGFYQDVIRDDARLEKSVVQLTRDHDILRILVREIQALALEETPQLQQIWIRFEALLLVNAIHSRDEEAKLLLRNSGEGDGA